MCFQGIMNGLMDKTRAGTGGAIASGPVEALVPDAPLRSVPAHEGGCYTIAFDRHAGSHLSLSQGPSPCAALCPHAPDASLFSACAASVVPAC